MVNKGMTTMAIKKINFKKVYSYIYQEKETSKLQIVQDLQMGLSTVSQNLKDLEVQGLIEKDGYLDSTGGRPAHLIKINSLAKTSIGIGVLKESIQFVLVDLYGNVKYKKTKQLRYENTDAYYAEVGILLDEFILSNKINSDSILGVSIAIQGIICKDGKRVYYGPIMNNENMKLEDISKYIKYPCRLAHDSKSAAYLELWNHNVLDNAVVILLNENLGGAVITNKQVHEGDNMRSGLIEHLLLDPNGPRCYCGSHGCFETYCSINTLLDQSKTTLAQFFENLRNGDPHISDIWNIYLTHLAQALRNISIIIDGQIVLSGHLAPYLTEEDIQYILLEIKKNTPFPIERSQILLGTEGVYTPTIGAALYEINDYLNDIMR